MKPKVVIIGSGFAGCRAAKELDPNLFEITLISKRNYFLFTPLLTSTTVGTIEFRSIIEPIRNFPSNLNFIEAECLNLNQKDKEVICKNKQDKLFNVIYDILIIAVGADNQTFNVPGVEQYTSFLKDIPDARQIRNQIISQLEQANIESCTPTERQKLLHFVVIGGGPTGVEFAGELYDLLQKDLNKKFPNICSDFKISLIEAKDEILSTFDQKLGQYTSRMFSKYKINVLTGISVQEINKNDLILTNGEKIDFGLAVWCTGIKPVPFIENLNLEKDKYGKIKVDQFLSATNSIYAIGDCATVIDHYFPATAQVAERQGKFLAKHLKRKITNKKTHPYQFKSMGMLAYIGGSKALADLPFLKISGFFTWIFWRSIYLTKLVSIRNRVLVLFDWIKTSLFGRDISKF